MTKETVTITLEEFNRLCDVDCFMDALIVSGVDNWDGYEEAQRILQEWESEDNE